MAVGVLHSKAYFRTNAHTPFSLPLPDSAVLHRVQQVLGSLATLTRWRLIGKPFAPLQSKTHLITERNAGISAAKEDETRVRRNMETIRQSIVLSANLSERDLARQSTGGGTGG